MAFEDSDRRRAVVLALLTLIAVPTFLLLARQSDDGVAADAGTAQVGNGDVPTTEARSNRPALEPPSDLPIFLDGPASEQRTGVPRIVVPARPEIDPVRFDASFQSTVAGLRTCLVRNLASGLTVTVRNLDNGRTVTCVTAVAPFTQVADLVMHTDTFSELADLTEAPIPVEVTQ